MDCRQALPASFGGGNLKRVLVVLSASHSPSGIALCLWGGGGARTSLQILPGWLWRHNRSHNLLPQTAQLLPDGFPASLSLECRRWKASKLPEGMWEYLWVYAEARPYGKQVQPLLCPLPQGTRALLPSSGLVRKLGK